MAHGKAVVGRRSAVVCVGKALPTTAYRLPPCALGLLLFAASLVWAAPATIEPDASLQAAIHQAAAAGDEAALQAALVPLRKAARPAVIRQLVYALMHARNDRQAMIAGIIVDRLAITPAELQTTLEPYRGSPDAKLRAQVANLLGKPAEASATPSVQSDGD